MTDVQLAAIRLETLVTAILAPRQSGKSHALALLVAWWACRARDQFVLIVSGGDTAAVRLMDAVRRLVRLSPLFQDSITRETTRRLQLSNGSVIESVPTSEFQIRSATTDLLVFDEAGLIPQGIVSAAEPTVAAREGGRIVYAGTPWALDSPFHRVVQSGDRGSSSVRTVRWSLDDAPSVNRALVDYHRETMPEAVFRAEYEGEWAAGSDALFSRELLDFASADYQLRDLYTFTPEVGVYAGVDWGRRHDQTAVVVIGRVPVGALNRDLTGPVFAVLAVHVWPRGTPTTQSVRDLLESPLWFRLLTFEDNGVGTGPADQLEEQFGERAERLEASRGGHWEDAPVPYGARGSRPWLWQPAPGEWVGPPRLPASYFNRVTTTAQNKTATLGELKAMLERRHLVIPRDGLLLRQLRGLRVEFRPSGTTSIQADSATEHDDVADACWLSLGPIRGEHGSTLGRAARVSGPDVPDATGGDVVESGGGVVIPKRPPVQCVVED
ncbi:MAG: terminase family protein, partial [Actinomycetota bacterium]|nr:terminase family protein [Actinomycetota bacterium]